MDNSSLTIVVISILGPILGSLMGVLIKPSERFIYNMLAFAGGVMLAISFLELIPESIYLSSIWLAIGGIISGSLLMFGIDRMIPHIHPGISQRKQDKNLEKTAFYLFIGIFLHNFPEGMAIAIGAVSGVKVSITVALAIAIHNIPEGICTSAPYYQVSKKRLKSFLISSATAIPILMGFLFANQLYQYISTDFIGFIVGATAGLMIYITTDEIIPSSCCKTTDHKTIFSLILGVLFVVLLGLI